MTTETDAAAELERLAYAAYRGDYDEMPDAYCAAMWRAGAPPWGHAPYRRIAAAVLAAAGRDALLAACGSVLDLLSDDDPDCTCLDCAVRREVEAAVRLARGAG